MLCVDDVKLMECTVCVDVVIVDECPVGCG